MLEKIKKGFSFTLVFAMLLTSILGIAFAAEGGTPDLPFTDVENHWGYDAIHFVYEHGIMQGTSGTTFSPDQECSRAMMVATLFRLHRGRMANDSDPVDHPFTDVTGWATPYVAWAFDSGVVMGMSETIFAPDVHVSRQEATVMLYRFASFTWANTYSPPYQSDRFPDGHLIGSWAEGAINWAVYHELIRGIAGNLEPRSTINRTQVATLLERFVELFTLCPELAERIKLRNII